MVYIWLKDPEFYGYLFFYLIVGFPVKNDLYTTDWLLIFL